MARRPLLVSLVSLVLAAAAAVPTTIALTRNRAPAADDALVHRLLEPGSRELTLTSPTNGTDAKAVITPTGSLVIADGLPVNDTKRTTYVLWAADTSGSRQAITAFDVTSGKPVEIATRRLPFDVDKVSQILISYEPGRHAPPAPSDVVLATS